MCFLDIRYERMCIMDMMDGKRAVFHDLQSEKGTKRWMMNWMAMRDRKKNGSETVEFDFGSKKYGAENIG